MKIAVLSGKGGAGKTFVAVNLAYCCDSSTYIDCDVEEPNGKLFFKPTNVEKLDVFTPIPKFDLTKCNGCRKCVDFCKFNALLFVKSKPIIFNEVCHACGGCEIVCPNGAISKDKRQIGIIEKGKYKNTDIITGILNISEASGIKVIEKAQEIGFKNSQNVIIDCPPGSACSVMESVVGADYCVLVAEPTIFGFHNFKMVYELTKILNKPCGVVINKSADDYDELISFCKNNDIPILANIKYSKNIANIISKGQIASEYDDNTKLTFCEILDRINDSIGGATV